MPCLVFVLDIRSLQKPYLGETSQLLSLEVIQRPMSIVGLLIILLLECQLAMLHTSVQKLGRKWQKRYRHLINPMAWEGHSPRNQQAWVQSYSLIFTACPCTNNISLSLSHLICKGGTVIFTVVIRTVHNYLSLCLFPGT